VSSACPLLAYSVDQRLRQLRAGYEPEVDLVVSFRRVQSTLSRGRVAGNSRSTAYRRQLLKTVRLRSTVFSAAVVLCH
jgi:hypothetical protein